MYFISDDRQRGRFAGFSLYVSNTDVSSSADIKGNSVLQGWTKVTITELYNDMYAIWALRYIL